MTSTALSGMTAEERERRRAHQATYRSNRGGNPVGRELWPFVPSKVIVRLLEPLAAEIGWLAIARMAGMGERRLYDLRMKQERCGFDTADRLITKVLGDPDLWHSVPELAEVYESC